ncbi:hypothetical protein ID871_09925 [Streptomyces pratensis]|nr:hypothetical protein [Streptomyces pratensis]
MIEQFKSGDHSRLVMRGKDAPLAIMREFQNSRCAICGRKVGGRGPNGVDGLVIDHNHQTHLVRGLLCKGCNSTEGRHNVKNPRYGMYRSKNPASILDLAIPYESSWRFRKSTDDVSTLSAQLHSLRDQIHEIQSASESVPNHLIDDLLKLATSALRAASPTKGQRGA